MPNKYCRLSQRGLKILKEFLKRDFPEGTSDKTFFTIIGRNNQCTCGSKLGHTQDCLATLVELQSPTGYRFVMSLMYMIEIN